MNRLTLKTKILMPLSMIVGLFILPSLAQATAIVGGSLFVQNANDDVFITFKSSEAGYTSTLSYNGMDLFTNHGGEGGTINLGSFAAGTVLNFELTVHNTGMTFSTGDGANNIDGMAHAMLENMGGGMTEVGFEDLYGGGDQDYNDLVFVFSNTDTGFDITNTDTGENIVEGRTIANPEPSTMILFGSGLLGLGAWRLRKK